MKIELYLSDSTDSYNFKDTLPEGISISLPVSTISRKGFGIDEGTKLIISFGATISAKFIANWLYDKLKNPRSSKIAINRREIYISQGEITRIIEEIINIENK